MRLRSTIAVPVLFLSCVVPCMAGGPRIHRGPTSPKLFKERTKGGHARTASVSMDTARATQIQTALIKAGYLSGAPSGQWDTATETAMQKLQADNGWQTKIVPDSRAIIKLGLGPGAEGESLTAEANRAGEAETSPEAVLPTAAATNK